jgi:hypothetical protein
VVVLDDVRLEENVALRAGERLLPRRKVLARVAQQPYRVAVG